jgi:hypothetical protein
VDVRDLVEALLRRDAHTAREWVAEARRAGVRWSDVPKPDLPAVPLAVAASIVELLAQRGRQTPPFWTASVPAAPESVYLVRAAEVLPRLRRLCELEAPEPLRKRRIFAPPEFLTAA